MNESPSSSQSGSVNNETNAMISSVTAAELYLVRCIDSADVNKLLLYTFILALGNAADAIEINCLGYIMSEMNDEISTSEMELLSAGVFFGMLLGGLVSGFLSDIFGRKLILLYSLGTNAITGLASAFAPNIQILIALRVLAGVGIGGSIPIVFSLCTEIFPGRLRGKLITIVASFWMVGTIFTAALAWIVLETLNYSWRVFAASCSLPIFVTLLVTLAYLPESPVFLFKKKKFEDCLRSLLEFSQVNVDLQQLLYEQAELESTVEHEMKPENSDIVSTRGEDVYSILQSPTEYIDDSKENLSSKRPESFLCFSDISGAHSITNVLIPLSKVNVRRPLFILGLIWFTLSFGSYGISTWISTLFEDIGIRDVYQASLICAVATLPGNIIGIMYVDKLGRCPLLIGGMLLASLAAAGLPFGEEFPAVVVTCAALFNAFSIVGWNALDCLSVESFPVEVRSTAMGAVSAVGRFGAISSQFVNGTLENNISLLFFVTSSCMMFGGLCGFLLDEINETSYI